MIGNSQEISQWLWNQDRDEIFEIKKFRKRRTNSQNSYAWELINELANKMTMTKEDMYLKLLEDYGQVMLVPIKHGENPSGYFKYFSYLKTTEINGKQADYYKVFKGSSEFTTLEMKYFLDGIIHECEQLGIPTLTDEQIERMKLI